MRFLLAVRWVKGDLGALGGAGHEKCRLAESDVVLLTDVAPLTGVAMIPRARDPVVVSVYPRVHVQGTVLDDSIIHVSHCLQRMNLHAVGAQAATIRRVVLVSARRVVLSVAGRNARVGR